MAPLPLYPHQAVTLDPAHLLQRYAVPHTSAPPYNYSDIVDGFLEGLILGYLLWALFYLVYIIIKFCVWVTRCTLDAIDTALVSLGCLCTTCSHPMCTGVCERYILSYPDGWTPETPRSTPTATPRKRHTSQNEKNKKAWPLPSLQNTDLWCVLTDEEMATLRRDKGVKNSLDRRRRSRTVGHVQYVLPVDQKERRKQIKSLQESVYYVRFVGPGGSV
jgi:hypothetical protein